jgi:hypothetical protein
VSATPLAFWLVPAEPLRSRLAGTIDALAAAHGGPRFEPHVTLEVGEAALPGDPAATLAHACAALAPASLAALGTGHSDALFRTLYVAFDDPRPAAIRAALRAAFGVRGDYALDPHLSLLYRERLDPALRARLATAHDHRGEAMRFDTVVLVRAGPGAGLHDIERLDTSVRARLGG